MSETQTIEATPSLLSVFTGKDPETLPFTDHIPDSVQLSRRELSLIIERLLMASGCPQGIWPGARDFVLEAVSCTANIAIDDFEQAIISRTWSPIWPVATFDQPDVLTFTGQPMILVGNTVANALLAFLTEHPDGTFTIRGLSSTNGHEGLIVRAAYFGFELLLDVDAENGTIRVTATPADPDPSSDQVTLLRKGLPVGGQQWWRLYQPSNFALSEETEISRSHTGVSETLLHYSI